MAYVQPSACWQYLCRGSVVCKLTSQVVMENKYDI